MSDFKAPRVTVPLEDPYFIDEELVERYDFEEELDDDEINEFDEEENAIVDNYDNWINLGQIEEDLKGLNFTTYKPPQILRVLSKVVRTTPSGQVVIDYELEVEEISGATSYEIRVLEQ